MGGSAGDAAGAAGAGGSGSDEGSSSTAKRLSNSSRFRDADAIELNKNKIHGLTTLNTLCVHGCALRPTRPSLRPRRALTSLIPASMLSISRSPSTRSLRGAAQGLEQQPAHRR